MKLAHILLRKRVVSPLSMLTSLLNQDFVRPTLPEEFAQRLRSMELEIAPF